MTEKKYSSRFRQLLLRPGPSDEAPSRAHGTQSDTQLWPLQEDGSLRSF